MMIVDAHAHLSETEYGNVKLYLDQLKQSGIRQGVVVPGGMLDVRKMTEYVTGRAKPDCPTPNNSYVEKSCQEHNEVLYGFVCIDPHDEQSVEIIERSFRAGFRGLKLSPLTHQFSFGSKAVAALVEYCGQYGYPVYSHVVYSPAASTAKFVSLARRFSGTNFILGHMGFGPADREALEAAKELDNLFLETSTGSFIHLQEAVKIAGPGKIIFGSEFPLSHPAVELKKIFLLKLTDDERERILGGNIRILLRSA